MKNILILILTCFAGFEITSSQKTEQRTIDSECLDGDDEAIISKEFPCPLVDDILPCICTHNSDSQTLTLDCSAVRNETELEAVFLATFPVTSFTELIIANNHGLTVLGDVFGSITFENVTLIDVRLRVITETSMFGSVDTLRDLYIRGSQLSLNTIPFLSFGLYPKLFKLYVGLTPDVDSFPTLSSTYLTYLDLPGNNLGAIPNDAFDKITNISVFSAYNDTISEITPGTFDGLVSTLRHVNMGVNSITRLLPGTLRVTNVTDFIRFYDNAISDVAVGAFVVQTGEVWSEIANVFFNNNQLTTLESSVWRDFLLVIRTLDLRNNPLTCGCDLAWLVLASDLMAKVHPDSSCYDGRLLQTLDPADYIEVC